MPDWSISFWGDDRGQSPVVRYLDQLAARERAKVARYLELLAEFGPRLSMPHARHIAGKLWELRPDAHRVFCALLSGHNCLVLHIYRKKGQKAPQREIDRALSRLADRLAHEED